MNLNSLVVFAKTAEVNSFSEAGRRLRMPVSTVSRHISELEDQLGVRLLERTTRRLRVTDVGTEILEHAQRSAELRELVSSVVLQHTAQIAGFLRISAPSSISDRLVTPLVREFQRSYPDVRIEISNENGIVDLIDDTVDLAFRLGSYKDSNLMSRRLMVLYERLLASPAYITEFGSPEHPGELRGHRLFASMRASADVVWRFEHHNGSDAETVRMRPHLTTNDLSGMAAALLDGRGIGNLPSFVRPELVADGQLVEVMPHWRLAPIDLALVHLGARHVPRALRLFTEFAAAAAPRMFPGAAAAT